MTFDSWLALIRDVAHTGDEQATLHLAQELMRSPRSHGLEGRWREVCAYAEILDLNKVARVMAAHKWRRNGRAVITPTENTHRLSRERYFAAWANEVPRAEDLKGSSGKMAAYAWWGAIARREDPSENNAQRAIMCKAFRVGASAYHEYFAWLEVERRVNHRALVQYLRARLWMEP